jgi:hypothetical protein
MCYKTRTSSRASDSKFQFYGVHDEDDELYWWGWNEIDSVNRRFVIEPAPLSLPLFVNNDRPRGPRLRKALPIAAAVNTTAGAT